MNAILESSPPSALSSQGVKAEGLDPSTLDLSVIIVNYNTWTLLDACIDSVEQACRNLQYEVIVVDNGSTDGSVENLRVHYPWVTLILNENNVGFGRANNQAMKIATGKFLFLLNSDTLMRNGSVQKVIEYMVEHDVALIGPKLVGSDGLCQVTWRKHFGPLTPIATLIRLTFRLPSMSGLVRKSCIRPISVEFLVGAALFVNHRVARRDGLFDEAFYFTGEEADLCLRLKRRGLRMVYYPDLEIMHYVSAGDVHRCFHVLNYLKSLKVFVRKYALLYYPVLYSLMILYVLKSILALTARYAIKRNMYSKTAAKRYWLILQWLLHLKEESQVLRDGACQ